MSDTNEAKEPGQVLFEASGVSLEWSDLFDIDKAEWAKNERVARDAFAPRLATLEAENRELHRRVSEMRVDAEAHRKLRVAAEHERNLLTDQVGRDVLSALVQEIPAEVRHATLAQRDEALKRAADLDAEVIALRARVEALMHGSETLERERDEALKERDTLDARVRYLDRKVDEERARAEKAERERDEARTEAKDQSLRANAAEIRSATAESAHVVALEVLEAEKAKPRSPRGPVFRTPFGDLTLHGLDYEDHHLRRALAFAATHGATALVSVRLASAPDLRPGDIVQSKWNVWRVLSDPAAHGDSWGVDVQAAQDDSATPMWMSVDDLRLETRVRWWRPGEVVPHAPPTVPRRLPEGSTGVQSDALPGLPISRWWRQAGLTPTTPADAPAPSPAPVRRPPFHDWTDAERAKLVPGASVMWWESRGVPPRRMTVFAIEEGSARGPFVKFAPFYSIDGGYLFNCDPLTIEPPATQAKRPACPSEECPACNGEACFKCGAGLGGPVDGRPPCEHDHDERHPKPATPATQAEAVRPPAPDLWHGDIVTASNPKFMRQSRIRVLAAPTYINGAWHVSGTDMEIAEILPVGTVPVAWCDLSSRIRTWQPGEIVPHAPGSVARALSPCVGVREGHPGYKPTLPLAEPWTQTGI